MKTVNFSTLLNDAVSKPGIISKAYSQFYDYSFGNQLLAWSQLSSRGLELSPIATYKKWQELGRQVKKGEKAIALVMPVLINKKDDQGNKTEDTLRIFTVKNNWFALSQTEGSDFAREIKIPSWDKTKALDALGITEAVYNSLDGNCQGYAFEKSIAINPVAQFPHKTRFHEIAHIVLGHTSEHPMLDSEKTPRDIKEVEAESVAYILCSLLDLPGLEESRGYIQNWLRDSEVSDKSAMRIFGAVDKILKAGQA